jgi:hypothetical protein
MDWSFTVSWKPSAFAYEKASKKPKKLANFFRRNMVNWNDKIIGSDEKDVLLGWDGKDQIVGGVGDDVLIGGKGKNIYQGGEGKDLFVVERYLSKTDKIKDFEPGIDQLLLYKGKKWDYRIKGKNVKFIADGYAPTVQIKLPDTDYSTIESFFESVYTVNSQKQLNHAIDDWIA